MSKIVYIPAFHFSQLPIQKSHGIWSWTYPGSRFPSSLDPCPLERNKLTQNRPFRRRLLCTYVPWTVTEKGSFLLGTGLFCLRPLYIVFIFSLGAASSRPSSQYCSSTTYYPSLFLCFSFPQSILGTILDPSTSLYLCSRSSTDAAGVEICISTSVIFSGTFRVPWTPSRTLREIPPSEWLSTPFKRPSVPLCHKGATIHHL